RPPRHRAPPPPGRVTPARGALPPTGALILYGRGADLGNFKVFADTLVNTLQASYGNRTRMENIEEKARFFDFLEHLNLTYKVRELPIFSHSFGAGLALGYHNPTQDAARLAAFNRAIAHGRNITAAEVLATEAGILFTDDLLLEMTRPRRAVSLSQFTSDATIKIWGCNAGVEAWTYHDDDYTGDGVADVYWTALNSSTPKPSIAQALADYFQKNTYGAQSGSHIEALDGGKWVTS